MAKVPMYLRTESKAVEVIKEFSLCKEYNGEHTVLAGDILAAAAADKNFIKKIIESKKAVKNENKRK